MKKTPLRDRDAPLVGQRTDRTWTCGTGRCMCDYCTGKYIGGAFFCRSGCYTEKELNGLHDHEYEYAEFDTLNELKEHVMLHVLEGFGVVGDLDKLAEAD